MDKEKILEAGRITSEVREWIRPLIKKGMLLIDIAEMIEKKVEELGGKMAFPTNLSINSIAAHYSPYPEDESIAEGLLKVDFGVHIGGWAADNAFSIDLEDSEENKELILASENSLKKALENVRPEMKVSNIGKIVSETMEEFNSTSVKNLVGHSIDRFDLHSGISVPNFDDNRNQLLEDGVYAIEPFSTKGSGRVRDGKPSGIYQIRNDKNIRSPLARQILKHILEEYNNLPFCSRWIVKKFGKGSLISLNQLEQQGIIYQFPQLVEVSGRNVAQTEHTILVEKDKIIITTK